MGKKYRARRFGLPKKSSMTKDAEKKYRAWKHRVGEASKILFCHSAIFSKINFEINLTYKCIKI